MKRQAKTSFVPICWDHALKLGIANRSAEMKRISNPNAGCVVCGATTKRRARRTDVFAALALFVRWHQ